MSEKDLMAAVVAAARMGNWLCFHTFDSRRSAPGFPDLVLVRGLQALFVECKTERGRLTVEQRQWLDGLQQAGLRAFVLRPDGLDALLAELLARPVLRAVHSLRPGGEVAGRYGVVE